MHTAITTIHYEHAQMCKQVEHYQNDHDLLHLLLPGRFNGKPRAGNSREIPVSRETGGEILSLGNSRILKAITFSSGVQIAVLKKHWKAHKFFLSFNWIAF